MWKRWTDGFAGDIAVTKLSYHAFAHLTQQYRLLDAGSALGKNCSFSLLVAKQPMTAEEIVAAHIAIPGKMTTANFLLGLAFPEAQHKTAVLFSDIEAAVLDGRFQAGLIIHENRLHLRPKRPGQIDHLRRVLEQSTGLPIPLGGIVVSRSLPLETQQKINRALRRSVEYAFAHQQDVMPYVRAHAQAMDEQVMRAHIEFVRKPVQHRPGRSGQGSCVHAFPDRAGKGLIPDFQESVFMP